MDVGQLSYVEQIHESLSCIFSVNRWLLESLTSPMADVEPVNGCRDGSNTTPLAWSHPPHGSFGPGISADIGARIILAPSFGISLEDMKTKIKGKVPQLPPAYPPNLFGPSSWLQGFLGLYLIWCRLNIFGLSWIQEMIIRRIPTVSWKTPNISRPKFLRICRTSFSPWLIWLMRKEVGCDPIDRDLQLMFTH